MFCHVRCCFMWPNQLRNEFRPPCQPFQNLTWSQKKKKAKPDLTWSKSFQAPNGWDDIAGRGGGGINEGNRTRVGRGNSNGACNLILTHQQSHGGETLMRGFNCVPTQMWCDGEISCSRNTGSVCSDARAAERFKGLREVKNRINKKYRYRYIDRYISTGKIVDSEEGIRGQAAQGRHVVDVWSPLMCEVLLCRGLPARESAASAAKSCTVSSIFILSVYSFVCVLFIRATCYNVFQNRVM